MASTLTRADERRAWPRWRGGPGVEDVACRIRPGHDAIVVDLSRSGMLVDTRRLVPGGVVEVQLDVGGRRAAARAEVLRCAVAAIGADGVMYRGALRFVEAVAVGDPPRQTAHG